MIFENNQYFDNHEMVNFCYDKESGLKAIIAIHNTNLGPALGGCRYWCYEQNQDALTDVLRLSKGMTYKAALADLPLGGGKTVILADKEKQKNPAFFKALGKFINRLNGSYITGEDVGTSVDDMESLKKHTDYVIGINSGSGGGDPSPVTAYGIFSALEGCAEILNLKDFSRIRFSVQGVGNVSKHLIETLVKQGAEVTIADINRENVKEIQRKFNVNVVDPEKIYDVEADIFVPCALGGIINDETIQRLKVKAICGAANNQLLKPIHGKHLFEKGIMYAPDFLVNAGGLINAYFEYTQNYNREQALKKTQAIKDTLLEIYHMSQKQKILMVEAAEKNAESRFVK